MLMEIFILIILTFFSSFYFKTKPTEKREALVMETGAFKKYLTPTYFKPIKIYTDQIDVNVQEVGVEEDGTLSVPSNWQDAGWYINSAKSGEIGNVIIDGHYDTNTGSPAAFWNLKNLKVNDKVKVVDEIGKEYIYKVTTSYYVDIEDPDRSDVFGGSKVPTVTLITCGGVWIPGSSTYSKRLVVKAELVS